jgi:HD-GYP domain-containing protein (c-di-GMP phosphodiesterase class II)
MRLECINRLLGDEVLGKNILTNDGKILLRAGVKLNSIYIKKLHALGVFYIYIEDNRLEDVLVEDDRLSELKQTAMGKMSDIVRNIHSCNRKNVKDSLSVVEDLVSYIIDTGDVNTSLCDIKTYDNYTYVHCLDTCIMSTFLGLSTGFNEGELKELGIGAILHDVGKTKISNKIINKCGALTDEEFEEIKRHPTYGEEILKKNMAIPNSILRAVSEHHERFDGNGYPNKLVGNQISKFAKVISICDVYDAISNDRSYREKYSPSDAYELILAGSDSLFDYSLVKSFKETFAVYPLGCCLKLSSGVEGYVIKQNANFPDRPIIRVLYDGKTRKPISFYEINLLENPSLSVQSMN